MRRRFVPLFQQSLFLFLSRNPTRPVLTFSLRPRLPTFASLGAFPKFDSQAIVARNMMSRTCISTENPLLDQVFTPKFHSIEAHHLTPAVDYCIDKLEKDLEALEEKWETKGGDNNIQYEDVLPALEIIQAELDYVWGVAGHLKGVKDSDELRKEYEVNQPKVVKVRTKVSQSRALWNALNQISSQQEQAPDHSFLGKQRRRAVTNAVRSMKLSGIGLEGEEKQRFNEIRMKLADIMTTFSNNILDATKAFSLTIHHPAQMEGVPSSAKAMWAKAHENYLKSCEVSGDDDNHDIVVSSDDGPWRITLDGPSYINAMQFLPDRKLRETIYCAFVTRASEENPEKNNVPLINEILSLKDEASKLLGFDTYAERSLASKMAPSVEAVKDLAELIASKALPAAYRDLDEIKEFAKSTLEEDYVPLEAWDVAFWSERLRENKFNVTKEQLRPYFALPNVLYGLFSLSRRLFGIEIVPVTDGSIETWHEDIQYFNVYDTESGKQLAAFFLDPYSRPSNKRGGAWMATCLGKSSATKRDIPVAYLNCNGSPPVDGKPSLMTFAEVNTLFHEFGHGLQHMLTKVEEGDVAGISGVEWDAVELPSQFMENWLYDKGTIYGFAKHYETGEPLPEDIFEKLKQQKTFSAGMMIMRQLYFGQMDMELHSSYKPSSENQSIFDVQRKMAEKYIPFNLPIEGDRFLCTFKHIFAGGYAAGYYSYKWADVMSADAFGAFEEVGLENLDEVSALGRKFRESVLELGGSVPPGEVFELFRGRQPTPDALLRHEGLHATV